MFLSVSKYLSLFFLLFLAVGPARAAEETQNVKIPAPQVIETEDSYTVTFPKEMALPVKEAPKEIAPAPVDTMPPKEVGLAPAVLPPQNVAPIPKFRADFESLIQKCDKTAACCRTSLRIIRDKMDAFIIKPAQQCPHGFKKGTLNCDGSYFWCEKL